MDTQLGGQVDIKKISVDRQISKCTERKIGR